MTMARERETRTQGPDLESFHVLRVYFSPLRWCIIYLAPLPPFSPRAVSVRRAVLCDPRAVSRLKVRVLLQAEMSTSSFRHHLLPNIHIHV